MEYPPLSEVRNSLRIKWYRCPIKTERLHTLLKRSDKQGWLQAGGHLTLWLLTGLFVYTFWSQQSWILMVLALCAHGTVSSFFIGVAPHELGHGTVFQTTWLNKLFLYLFSFISWWDPFDYASSHTYHHRYTLHPHGDRENLLPLPPNTGRTFLLQMVTLNIFTEKGRSFGKGGLVATFIATVRGALGEIGSTKIPSNEWLAAIHTDQPDEHQKSILWSRFLLLTHGLVVTYSLGSGQWIFILIVTLPSFICNIFAYAVGMTQHSGLKQSDADFRKSVRSITINPLLEFLYWRMNWHTEHHMFAGVPCYHLKQLHKEVASNMPRPRSLNEAWREMLDTWKIQQENPEYFHDTPIPDSSGTTDQNSTDDTAKNSIGELAPKGLR